MSTDVILTIITDIQNWLSTHQLFAFSIVVPLFGALSAWISSVFAVRRALRVERERRDFQSLVKISEFRQAWINRLRDLFSRYAELVTRVDSYDARLHSEIIGTQVSIGLMMNPIDPDYKKLLEAMTEIEETMRVFSEVNQVGRVSTPPQEIQLSNDRWNAYMAVTQAILKREWDRIKAEIEDKV